MTVTNVKKDATAMTMVVTAQFDAPIERVWQLYADPRQLERWWGPPEWPATVTEHDFKVGGTVNYHMTGPDGTKAGGWWRITKIDPPRRLEFEDGFADDHGTGSEMPTMHMTIELSEGQGGGTSMTATTKFPTKAAMEQILSMGMEEGMQAAMGQMDELLAGTPSPRR